MINYNEKRLCIDINTVVKIFFNTDINLIDIRDEHSFKLSHIYGSQNISFNSLENFSKLKNTFIPTMIICYHGIISQYIALYLSNKGFKKVYSINGGFKEWSLLFPNLIQNN